MKPITEEKARMLVCPMGMGAEDVKPLCLGTKCMAFRWTGTEYTAHGKDKPATWEDLYVCEMCHGRAS